LVAELEGSALFFSLGFASALYVLSVCALVGLNVHESRLPVALRVKLQRYRQMDYWPTT
jgi:hypothetical protein